MFESAILTVCIVLAWTVQFSTPAGPGWPATGRPQPLKWCFFLSFPMCPFMYKSVAGQDDNDDDPPIIPISAEIAPLDTYFYYDCNKIAQ